MSSGALTSRVLQFGSRAGTNAVPLVGFFGREWMPMNAMLLYLFENVVTVMLAMVLVRVVLSSNRPQWEQDKRKELLKAFALVAGAFTFGSAVFITFIAFLKGRVDLRELAIGFAIVSLFQLLGFFAKLSAGRNASFADCETLLERALGRVFLLALAVFAGLALAVFGAPGFVAPFLILKTIVDLWPSKEARIEPTAA